MTIYIKSFVIIVALLISIVSSAVADNTLTVAAQTEVSNSITIDYQLVDINGVTVAESGHLFEIILYANGATDLLKLDASLFKIEEDSSSPVFSTSRWVAQTTASGEITMRVIDVAGASATTITVQALPFIYTANEYKWDYARSTDAVDITVAFD